MNACPNCLCRDFVASSYHSISKQTRLPALECLGCGCLELDDGRLDEILAALNVPRPAHVGHVELRNLARHGGLRAA